MGRYLLIAARNLVENRRRTALLGGAIAFATMLLVLLTSATTGIKQSLMEAAISTSSGHINIAGYFKPTAAHAVPILTDAKGMRQLVTKAVPEAEDVVVRLVTNVSIVSPTSDIGATVAGIELEMEKRLAGQLSMKRGALTDLAQKGTILLFESQAKELGVGVGDMVIMRGETVRGSANAVDLRVVAVAEDKGRLSSGKALTSKQTLRMLMMVDASVTSRVLVYLPRAEGIEVAIGRLAHAVEKAGHKLTGGHASIEGTLNQAKSQDWRGHRIGLSTWEHEVAAYAWVPTAFRAVMWVVVGVLLIIIAVGTTNVLWVTIRQRTREIGTLRAIGISRIGVLTLFAVEGALLSLGSTVFGAALGGALGAGLNAAQISLSAGLRAYLFSEYLVLVISWKSIIVAVVTVSLVSMIFSLFPSYRASRLRPVVALRHTG